MGNFLVTDLKVIDSPQAGIGVARCLKMLGCKVYGGDDTPLVTSSNIFEKTFVIEEIRNLNLDSLVKKLIELKNLYGIEYIIPCYDETAILFSYIKDKLDYIGIQLIASSLDSVKKLRKDNLSNIFNSDNFASPETNLASSLDEARGFAEKMGYPVVVKGLTKGAFIANDQNELENAIKKVCGIWNNNEIKCLIQKFIKGKFINLLVAFKNGKIVSYLEMEKISLDSNGATWFGKLTTERQLFEDTLICCQNLQLSDSIIEIETILAENGKYYVYEVNYRPPAWIYAAALNGQNFLEIYLNPKEETIFGIKEAFFGRESCDFIRPVTDISQYTNLQFYSKGAAYKTANQKYPSELML